MLRIVFADGPTVCRQAVDLLRYVCREPLRIDAHSSVGHTGRTSPDLADIAGFDPNALRNSQGQLRPTWLNFCPNSARIRPNSSFHSTSAKFGPNRLIWPSWGEFRPTSPELSRIWDDAGAEPKFGQGWLSIGRIWTDFGRMCGPDLSKFCPESPTCCKFRPNLAHSDQQLWFRAAVWASNGGVPDAVWLKP